MYCVKCGSKVDAEATFCENCGHKLENDVGGNTVIKTKKRKNYVIGLGGIIIIGMILGIIISRSAKEDFAKTEINGISAESDNKNLDEQNFSVNNSYTKLSTNRMVKGAGDITSDDEITTKEVLYNSDKLLDIQPYTDESTCYRINGDGSIAIGHDFEGQYIFCIQKGQKTKVSDVNLWYVDNMKISYEGMCAACVMDSELYYIDIERNEINCVDINVSTDGFVLSPNGKVMVYLGAYNNKIDNEMFLYKQTETGAVTTHIGEDVSLVLAVNDNADAVFYIKTDGKLYFYNGKEEKTLSQNTILANQEDNCIIFNESCTEAIYLDGEMITRFKVSEGKAASFNRELKKLDYRVPKDIAFLSEYSEVNKLGIVQLGKQTLDKIVIVDEALYYVEGNKLIKLTDNPENSISQVWVADDFQTIMCTKNEGIYQYTLNLNMNEKCIYQENNAVIECSGSSDLKEMYIRYLSEDKIVHIADGVIQQEWEIETMQGRYSDILGEYIYSNSDREIYMLSQEESIYLGESTWPWPILDVGQGQIWLMIVEKDSEGYLETFYSLKKNCEMNKIFSRRYETNN